MTASSESSHSVVSPGSMSGSWWTKPSISISVLAFAAAHDTAAGPATRSTTPCQRTVSEAAAPRRRSDPPVLVGEEREEVPLAGHEIAVLGPAHRVEQLPPPHEGRGDPVLLVGERRGPGGVDVELHRPHRAGP